MKVVLMAVLLTVSTSVFSADSQTEDMRALVKAQQDQIDLLQQQLNATQQSLQSLREQVEKMLLPAKKPTKKQKS